jgi:hypothetical protein
MGYGYETAFIIGRSGDFIFNAMRCIWHQRA